MMKILLYVLCHLLAGISYAQSGYAQAPDMNRKRQPLLLDINVQIEATQAVNDMYNFKFASAEKQFRWLKQKYAWHPLPYFLLGLSEWWKIVPNIEEKKYDNKFLAYMDTAVARAQLMLEKDDEDPEAAFFMAAGYAFQGRLYSERHEWGKATVTGKNALKYLDISKGNEDFSPELLLGDALYNYYVEWIPENYPILKPVLMFFQKGDKELGIQQLKTVANNAFYTRTEAQYFLMRILAEEGNAPQEAFRVAEYLHHTFPDNAYFHRYYTQQLYTRGKLHEAETESKNILQKLDSGMVGYEATSGRYAGFFLGQIYEMRGQLTDAQQYYLKAVDYSKQVNATQSGYYHWSLLKLGEIAQAKNELKEAENYYKEVRKEAKRKNRVHEVARENLKALRKLR